MIFNINSTRGHTGSLLVIKKGDLESRVAKAWSRCIDPNGVICDNKMKALVANSSFNNISDSQKLHFHFYLEDLSICITI